MFLHAVYSVMKDMNHIVNIFKQNEATYTLIVLNSVHRGSREGNVTQNHRSVSTDASLMFRGLCCVGVS